MAVETGYEIFGRNMFVYQIEYFRLFTGLGIEGTLPYETYKKLRGLGSHRNIEFFFMGRAAYRLGDDAPRYRADDLFWAGCVGGFQKALAQPF